MTGAILSEYLSRTKDSRNVRKNLAVTVFVFLLFAIWSFLKDSFVSYLVASIPILLINLLIIVYGCSQKASDICISGVCIINLCAAMAQAVIGFENSLVIYAFAVVATVVFAYIIRTLNPNFILFASGVVTILIFMLCCVMPETNGARAWLKIGSTPIFQLTEVAKLCYVVFIGALFTSKYNDYAKFFLSVAVTLISAVMLALRINEFGTLLVMCSALYCTAMISVEKKAWRICWTLGVLVIIGAFVLSYFTAESKMEKWKCPECAEINHGVIECEKCDKNVKNLEHDFKCELCRYTTFGPDIPADPKERSAYTNCDECKKDGFFTTPIGKISKKIYDRTCAIYNYEYVKVLGDTYHVDQNINSMKVGKLFGNKDAVVYIPNMDTDSVVAALMNKLGAVFALLILIAFYMVFWGMNNAKSPLRMMAICTFVFQALYTFAGTFNILPMTGIGMPLISRGGSNLLISFIMIYLMLSAVHKRDNKEGQK